MYANLAAYLQHQIERLESDPLLKDLSEVKAHCAQLRAWMQEVDGSHVRIPTNVEEARAMALLGMNWLQTHEPESLCQFSEEDQLNAERWRFATSNYAEENTDIAVCKGGATAFGVDANDIVDKAMAEAREAYEQSLSAPAEGERQ